MYKGEVQNDHNYDQQVDKNSLRKTKIEYKTLIPLLKCKMLHNILFTLEAQQDTEANFPDVLSRFPS